MLAVDLDNTLVKTDVLYESFVEGLSSRPFQTLASLAAIRQGPAGLKAALARDSGLDVTLLPYNGEVLALIEAYRQRGEPVVLVSASDHRLVSAVADHLGLFDDAFGSKPGRNLKGARKAQFLVERYGEGAFDYVGDAPADLKVWKHARKAITLGLSSAQRTAVEALGVEVQHLNAPSGRSGQLSDYWLALRPWHWSKNLVIFVPALALYTSDWAAWSAAVVAFVAFSLLASCAYIINDLLDLKADRRHPTKHARPFASGALPILHGLLMAPLLIGMGFLLALLILPMAFCLVLAGYLVLSTLYSLYLKRLLVVDIAVLCLVFLARLYGGAVAASLDLSWWIMFVSVPIVLSLSCMKQLAELICCEKRGMADIPGRSYSPAHRKALLGGAMGFGYSGVAAMIAYTYSGEAEARYHSPHLLWIATLVLFFWITHLLITVRRKTIHHDTMVFTLYNMATLVSGAAVTAVYALLARV